MSDMRFIILGIALIFAGFIILGAFGHEYQAATLNQTSLEHVTNILKINRHQRSTVHSK